MKHEVAFLREQFFGRADVEERLARLEATVVPLRGPKSTITMRTLVAGLVAAILIQGSPQVASAARIIEGMTRHQRRSLGIKIVPTESQLRRRLQRLETVINRDTCNDLDEIYKIVEDLASDLLAPSTVPATGPVNLAVDTSLVDVPTPHYSQQELDMIADPEQRPAFKNSTRRGLRRLAGVEQQTLRKHLDLDATYRVVERFTGPEITLGYGIIATVEVDGALEQCMRLSVRSANQHDVPPAVAAIRSMLAQGAEIASVLADRGFSQSPEKFLDGLRSVGLPVVFDLKSTQQGYRGTINGLLEIDGWLFLPSLPKKYWDLKRPAVTASDEDKAEYDELVNARAQWAMRVKQAVAGDPTKSRKVQLYSPVIKGSAPSGFGIRCQSCPTSMANPNPALKVCRKGCKPGQGCATKTIVWGAAQCPDTYQPLLFGTTAWKAAYVSRSGVERFFSRLKNAKGVDFASNLKVRGIIKVTLMTALADVATNLRLRFNRDYENGWRGPDE